MLLVKRRRITGDRDCRKKGSDRSQAQKSLRRTKRYATQGPVGAEVKQLTGRVSGL